MQKKLLGYALLAAILLALLLLFVRAGAQDRVKPTIGIITGSDHDSLFASQGYAFREEGVGNSFSPRKVSEPEFIDGLGRIRNSRCKVLSANSFFHGYIKLVGPDRNEQVILGYADTVFRRASMAGLKIVVLGSGDARRIPDGYDHGRAREEFVDVVRKMAVIAGKYDITIAMENLNSGETNFGNSLAEVVGIVRDVNDIHFRATADIYHMLRESEPPSSIAVAGKLLVHCHIAENKDRARPGKNGEDFRPYFNALKLIGYSGLIMMECGWTNMEEEAGPALKYLQGQLDEAFQ
jgi:sugar phosphate isomerase/epimerase